MKKKKLRLVTNIGILTVVVTSITVAGWYLYQNSQPRILVQIDSKVLSGRNENGDVSEAFRDSCGAMKMNAVVNAAIVDMNQLSTTYKHLRS